MKRVMISLLLLFGVCVAATAQSDYNYQRRSLFEILPIDNDDIVFLGNSITDGAEWSELFGCNPNIKNRGISGDRVDYLGERLDPILEGQPRKLFLMIGINDVSDKKTPEEIVSKTRAVVERFVGESPQTTLYIQSVLPVNTTKPKMARQVARGVDFTCVTVINTMLQDMCEELHLTYIDLYSKLVDSDGNLNECYSNDGLHLLGAGYIVWRDTVLPYIK